MIIRELFASNLRRLRRLRGFSQEELAYRAEIDRTYVSSLERCVYAATLDIIERLAVALEVDAVEFLKRPTPRGGSRR